MSGSLNREQNKRKIKDGKIKNKKRNIKPSSYSGTVLVKNVW